MLFAVIQFEQFVYPDEICIFETYNPGAIVQLWAYTIYDEWICLWQQKPAPVTKQTRLFRPTIKRIRDPTNIIRIDFNHKYLDYYTEIDAVMLSGKKYFSINVPPQQHQQLQANRKFRRGPILRKLESVRFRPMIVQNYTNVLNDFLYNELDSFIIECSNTISKDENIAQYRLESLPVIIFSYFTTTTTIIILFTFLV